MIWRIGSRTLDLSRHARVMGILNTTPDSFSDGGTHHGPAAALAAARAMIAEGATIIDIGGESTRPGADEVPADIETARTVPVIAALRAGWDGFISIDTMKAETARAALAAGADIVNDVSGLRHAPDMSALCRDSGCGVVVMHMQGTPRTMQTAPRYDDVAAEVSAFFAERLAHLTNAGIAAEALVFDPGIGFGKTLEHNMELLRHTGSLSAGGRPLLLGCSRKSFLGKLLGLPEPASRDCATAVVTALARRQGVMLHRVHAVAPAVAAVRLAEELAE